MLSACVEELDELGVIAVPVMEFIWDKTKKRNENGIVLLYKERIPYFHT
jgi:hypothetical protein